MDVQYRGIVHFHVMNSAFRSTSRDDHDSRVTPHIQYFGRTRPCGPDRNDRLVGPRHIGCNLTSSHHASILNAPRRKEINGPQNDQLHLSHLHNIIMHNGRDDQSIVLG